MEAAEILKFAIVKPLTEATAGKLKPLVLAPDEYLVVGLDDDGKRFTTKAIRVGEGTLEAKVWTDTEDKKFCEIGPAATYTCSWFLRCPEALERGYGRADLTTTDINAIIMSHAWPKDRLIFVSPAAKMYFDFLLLRFVRQTKVAEKIARWKIEKLPPELPDDWFESKKFPLGEYQRVAVEAFLEQPVGCLFMDPGTGKTATAISRACIEAKRKSEGRLAGRKTKSIYRVLVICPPHLRMNWENEFEKFGTVKQKLCVLRGGELRKMNELYETIRSQDDYQLAAVFVKQDSVDGMRELLLRVSWDLVILDECHNIKSASTKRWKSLRHIFHSRMAHQKMILSGTPIANSVMDIWAQWEILGEGLSGFSSKEAFKHFHGEYVNIGDGIQKLTALKNVAMLQERMSRLCFICSKEEANLFLPDKIFDIHEVEMTANQSEYYAKIREQIRIEIEDYEESMESSNYGMFANHVLTRLLRLAQITSGHATWADEDNPLAPKKVEQIAGGNPKIQAVLELLAEKKPEQKTIVWAVFVEDIRALSIALAAAGIKHVKFFGGVSEEGRQRAVDDFNNDPETKVFIGNPAAGGTGINLLGYDMKEPDRLPTYCDHVIIFSKNWSIIQRLQSIDRAHRRGTKNSVRVTDLICPGTVDEECLKRLEKKKQDAYEVQDIREILTAVVGAKNE